jgi:hypothetical protein
MDAYACVDTGFKSPAHGAPSFVSVLVIASGPAGPGILSDNNTDSAWCSYEQFYAYREIHPLVKRACLPGGPERS